MKKAMASYAAVVLMLACGCAALTPEEDATVNRLGATLREIAAEIESLLAENAVVVRSIEAVVAKVASGEMPAAEGAALVDAWKASKDQRDVRIAQLSRDQKLVVAEMASLNASIKARGASVWESIGTILGGILAGVLGLRGAQKIRPEKEGLLGI